MKAWRVVQKGSPRKALELQDVALPDPAAGQLRVRTSATALNFNEIDGCYGRYRTVDPALPYTLGMEAVGEVDAAGPGLEGWIGRRVATTGLGATGAHAEWVLGDANMSFESPASLSDVEAAAFFFPFHVAYLSVFERGHLREGETLLVHAAAGGVGSAALQLGVASGARVFATAGGAEKVAFCKELGAEVAIDYRSEDFAPAVLEATGGSGVDVVCDLVGGEVTTQSFRCMAFGGRHMMTGFSGGIEAEDEGGLVPRPILFGNFSVGGVLMAYGESPRGGPMQVNLVPRAVGEAIQARLVEWLEAGRIRPLVGRVADYREIVDEYERMEARATMGRSILRWREDDAR